MSSKISRGYIKTADNNNKLPQLLEKDFRNIEHNNVNELKRKIDTIARYQKHIFQKC